ncbi:MAG: APC family permease, partial [Methanobacterium sp.]
MTIKEVKTKATIGLWSAIAIGIGGMIGAGVFSVLGLGITIGGNLVYISYIIGGIIALLSAYSYAKLSICYPSAGGSVEFLIRGFEDSIISGGFNFLLWSGYIFALSLYAEAFGIYASTFLPASITSISTPIIAILIILVFTLINFLGPEVVGRSETFIVGVKVSILIIFAFLGVLFVKGSLLSVSNFPGIFGILTATAIIFLGYEGFGLIANTAEDIKNPRKNIPIALYLAIIIAMLIYVAVSLAVVGNLPLPEIIKSSDYALAAAAYPFAGPVGFTIIAIAALFSTASAINATLYGGVNVCYLMAKEGELPSFFTIKKWRDAKEGLFITAGIVIILTL